MCWVRYTGDGISPGNSTDAAEAAASKNYRDSFSSSKHGTRCYTVEDSFRKLLLQSNLQALQFVLKADWSWNSVYPGEEKAAGAEES